MRVHRILLAAVVCLFVATIASAAIVPYNERIAWEGAAGFIDLSEDFESFGVDTDFKTSPVGIGVGTIEQVGPNEDFRNIIDVPPFLFTDNNGTNGASCFVNHPEGGAPPPLTGPGDEETPPEGSTEQTGGTDVLVTFASPVSAFGADYYGVLGGEFLAVDVIGVGDVTLATLLPTDNAQSFMGFVADGGESVIAVLMRSQNLTAGGGGEGFGMDDLDAVSGGGGGDGGDVPATTGVGLLLLVLAMGGGAAYFTRRR